MHEPETPGGASDGPGTDLMTTDSSGWAENAGSRDYAYGTYAPPFCGSGSPAPRRARFGDVGEPPDHSYKTLTTSTSRRLAPQNHPAIPYLAKRPAPLLDTVARPRRRVTRGERAPRWRRRAASLSAGEINRGRTDALRQGTMRPRKPFPGRRLRRWCSQSSGARVGGRRRAVNCRRAGRRIVPSRPAA
jgi:hypothetical protein